MTKSLTNLKIVSFIDNLSKTQGKTRKYTVQSHLIVQLFFITMTCSRNDESVSLGICKR